MKPALCIVIATVLGLSPLSVAAQPADVRPRMPSSIFVGSDAERYLRVLQTLGGVRAYPWSIRGFSLAELDSLGPTAEVHPWRQHPRLVPTTPRPRLPELIAPSFQARYNTAFPFGLNDGPVWAGRGLTATAQAGAAVRRGPLSVVAAPVLFWAENRDFDLFANGQSDQLRYADPLYPTAVDRPQRFGNASYSRLDPGQTTVRLDYFATIGFSTASQWWGPMTEFPYLLGNNAGGFPHFFVGTATPANLWIARLHFRVMYGGLTQSAYTDVTGREEGRLASGVIALITPRGVPGLELGAARFFHTFWPDSGIGSRELRRPFQAILKLALPDDGINDPGENQLASIFARWVLPRAGVEVYGEYGREDHNGDTRDLIQEPDHIATYGLGLQKAWAIASGAIVSLRGELLNFEISSLARHREQGAVYLHSLVRQGHTHRGQLLGSGFAVGSGAGSTLRLERFTPRGSESISWARLVSAERDNPAQTTTRCSEACVNVQHVIRADRSRSYGRLELRYGLTLVHELNRYFERDETNVSPEVELRWRP